MKKQLFLAAALLGLCGTLQAQSELHTYSVYDVNHKDGVSVADAAQVVSRAIETIQEDPQVVTAEELNATVQQFNQLLQQNNALLSSLSSRVSIIEQSIKSLSEGDIEDPFNGHAYVDLGMKDDLGRTIYWATCNVGANEIYDSGYYYAWGETQPHQNNAYSESSYTYKDSPTVLPLDHDAAHVNWQGQWRMPTKYELELLKTKCNWQWTTINGNAGYKVTNRSDESKWIFLPAAGCRSSSNLNDAGSYGDYWSSSLDSEALAYGLFFGSISIFCYDFGRYYGFTVRPVCVLSE